MDKTLSFILDTGFDDLPQVVIDQTQACLMELIAVAAAASPLPEVAQMNRYVQRRHPPLADSHPSRLLFSGGRSSAGGAALANATALGIIDGHSWHAGADGHVGGAVLAVLLALTEGLPANRRPDGRAFLTLLCIGYEIGIRLGMASKALHGGRHSSGSWNAMTCAALAARLLAFSHQDCRKALGIAEQIAPMSGIPLGNQGAAGRMNTSGWSAFTGIESAFLVLETRLEAHAPLLFDPSGGLWDDLGTNWRIMEQCFQSYPLHRWLHGPVEAALEIRSMPGFDAARIAAIETHIFEAAATGRDKPPETAPEAQANLSWAVATALLKGRFEPEDLRPQALQDKPTKHLAGLVNTIAEPDYSALYPKQLWCRLSVTFDNGMALTSNPCKPLGDPENPVSAISQEARYTRYTSPVLGPTHSRALRAELPKLSQPDHKLDRFLALLLRGL